jgi:PAS domain-containing protein
MERKSLEKELNVIYTALSSAANGVLITDGEGSVQYANPAFIGRLVTNPKKRLQVNMRLNCLHFKRVEDSLI